MHRVGFPAALRCRRHATYLAAPNCGGQRGTLDHRHEQVPRPSPYPTSLVETRVRVAAPLQEGSDVTRRF